MTTALTFIAMTLGVLAFPALFIPALILAWLTPLSVWPSLGLAFGLALMLAQGVKSAS